MPVVQLAKFAPQRDIEGFPLTKGSSKNAPKFERSCEGALHLRPGTTAVITDDELEFIKESDPKLFKQLRVLAASQKPRPEKPTPAAPESETKASDEE